MLLNLSNHPSQNWTPKQLSAAKNTYGRLLDMRFPNIPPALSETQLDDLVEEYFFAIVKENPKAIHLMGEMTFTFRLVNRLKAAGMVCIASTTNRTVEERDGKKIVQFEFVQFRAY